MALDTVLLQERDDIVGKVDIRRGYSAREQGGSPSEERASS